MKNREICNRIRGWLPQEPTLPRRATPNQAKPHSARAVFINIIVGFLVVTGLFCSVLLLSSSWIKLLIIALALTGGLLWLVSRTRLRSIFKYVVVLIMIFAISFTSLEAYFFQNSGYPITYSPTKSNSSLSMQTILNASLTEIVAGIEQSAAFSLLKLEHGNIILESIGLNPIGVTEGIEVRFFIEDVHAYAQFTSWGGHQYHVSISQLIGQPFSEKYSSMQTVQEPLMQIDALNLQGFYDKALQIAQNRTLDLPTIDSLSISISYESHGEYQGMTLQMLGYHETVLPDGRINGNGVLIADFKPDGTLIYMTKPQTKN